MEIKIDGEKVKLIQDFDDWKLQYVEFDSCEDIGFEHAWKNVTNSNIYRKCLNCRRIQKLDKMPYWEDIKR